MPTVGVVLSGLLLVLGLRFLPITSSQEPRGAGPERTEQTSPVDQPVEGPADRLDVSQKETPRQPSSNVGEAQEQPELPVQSPLSSPNPPELTSPPSDPLAAAEARKQAAFERYTRLATTGDAEGDINEALTEYREAVRALEELKGR